MQNLRGRISKCNKLHDFVACCIEPRSFPFTFCPTQLEDCLKVTLRTTETTLEVHVILRQQSSLVATRTATDLKPCRRSFVGSNDQIPVHVGQARLLLSAGTGESRGDVESVSQGKRPSVTESVVRLHGNAVKLWAQFPWKSAQPGQIQGKLWWKGGVVPACTVSVF